MSSLEPTDTPRYPYVHLDVSAEDVDLASLSLWEEGALGVEERDESTFAKAEGSGGNAGGSCTLVGSFESTEAAEAAIAALADRWAARLVYVVGEDWRDGWRAHFKPLRVGARLVIRPSWEPWEAQENDIVLTLDPGGAFGTGTHESTQLVLRLLEGRVQRGQPLLDVGCGSGILAVAALLLGAGSALGIDTDPAAVEATLENGEINGVASRLRASDQSVESLEDTYPLVLANIEAHVLGPIAEALCARVAPGGLLILSGLLKEQGKLMEDAYAACGPFHCVERAEQGDWIALVLQRGTDG